MRTVFAGEQSPCPAMDSSVFILDPRTQMGLCTLEHLRPRVCAYYRQAPVRPNSAAAQGLREMRWSRQQYLLAAADVRTARSECYGRAARRTASPRSKALKVP